MEKTDLQSFKKFLQVKGHFSVCKSITMSPKLVTISIDITSVRWGGGSRSLSTLFMGIGFTINSNHLHEKLNYHMNKQCTEIYNNEYSNPNYHPPWTLKIQSHRITHKTGNCLLC